jgi:hypothetical protein
MPYLFDNCIMISQIWAWNPLSSEIWWPRRNTVGWVGIQVCQHLDIGEHCRLRVENLHIEVSRCHSIPRRYLTLIVVIWAYMDGGG